MDSVFLLLNNWSRINLYPADSVIDFCNTYPLDSDLSGGYRYPTFEQPGPGELRCNIILLSIQLSYLLSFCKPPKKRNKIKTVGRNR